MTDPNQIAELRGLLAKMPAGAKRALLGMTTDWQFPGKTTFNANGAWSLHWTRGAGGRGAFCEMENRPAGRSKRGAYRLTLLGQHARASLKETSNDQ